jgi:hypothetical protein
VKGDLDGVPPQAEQFGDLTRGQVGAVAKRHELTVALLEPADRPSDVEAQSVVVLGSRLFWGSRRRQHAAREDLVDGVASDAD